LLHDQWVIEEIREEIKKFLKYNENENTTYHNLMQHSINNAKEKLHSFEGPH
jgi:hypothetical protein